MPKDTTKPKVSSISLHLSPSLSHYSPQRKAAEKAEKAPTRNSKSKKDPKAPKRALSAYMFFSQDWRERIKAENPDAGFGEVGKLLGAKWKEMSDEEKKVSFLSLLRHNRPHPLPFKPYIDAAAADKARAEKDKAAYDVSPRFFCFSSMTYPRAFRNRARRAQVQKKTKTKSDMLSIYPSRSPSLSSLLALLHISTLPPHFPSRRFVFPLS